MPMRTRTCRSSAEDFELPKLTTPPGNVLMKTFEHLKRTIVHRDIYPPIFDYRSEI
jgi:hypothetical protein